MAEETINLFEITIDTDKAVQDTIALKQEVEKLKAQTKQAKEEQGEFSAEYVEYASALKSAQGDLRTQETLTKNIISANHAQSGSIDQLRKQLSVVSKQWADLSEDQRENTEEGKKLTKQKLDLTNALKAEEKATGDNRREVGNYKLALDELPGSLGGAAKGFKEMGAAAKAFILNPIGLIIAGIVGAFTLLYKALSSTEGGMNKLNKIGAIFSGVFSGIMKVLEPLANFIIDKVIVAFDTLGNVATKAIDLVAKGLDVLGFEKAAESVEKFNEAIAENVKGSIELSDARAKLVVQQRLANKLQLDFQKQAEKLRQIRDDEALSLDERNKANEDLNKTLQQQLAAEVDIANQALAVADLRIKIEGENTAALDERAEALTRISDIQERLAGQESEYLMNVNSLKREQLALDKEAVALGLAQFEKEVQDFKDAAIAKDELDKFYDDENEKRLARRDQSRIDRAQRKADAEALNFANEYEVNKMNLFAILDLEKQGLEEQRLQEIEYAEKIGADVTLVNQKYADANKEIAEVEWQAKVALAGGFANNIATIFGENSKIGKAAAIASTTISTYQGATAAYASLASIPVVGPGLGVVAASAAIAAGLQNVRKIIGVKIPGGGGGGSAPSGGASYGAVNAVNAVTPEVGQGIISRESQQNKLTDQSLQPTLVVDSVTNAQNNSDAINTTASI